MSFKILYLKHPKKSLKIKKENIDIKSIMLQTKNGSIKNVGLKDINEEKLLTKNIGTQTIMKSEFHIIQP